MTKRYARKTSIVLNLEAFTMLRTITLLLALLTLHSCAAMVPYQKAVDSFIDSTPCCDSMAEFNYEPLPYGEPLDFRFNESSQSFIFPSGKSYFKAFRLPEKETPYLIHLKSFALGETIKKAHIFYPQLALLNANFAVRKRSRPHDFVLKKAGFKETASVSWGLLRLKLKGFMVVDIPDAKYLLVYTTRELLAETSKYKAREIQPIPAPIPGGVLIGAVPTYTVPAFIPHSPFGWISIKIEND